jgi:RNA polymerase sigma factor (sigma-70 family)
MSQNPDLSVHLDACIDRLHALGNGRTSTGADARETERKQTLDELFCWIDEYVLHLVRQKLRAFPGVARWEGAEDVRQRALLKIWERLKDHDPDSARSLLMLVATKVRDILVDLLRHYFGPQGEGAHHASWLGPEDGGSSGPHSVLIPVGSSSLDPTNVQSWTEYQEQVDRLPEKEREVFALRWYLELPEAEIASRIGVNEGTVKRRWARARLLLARALGERPGS